MSETIKAKIDQADALLKQGNFTSTHFALRKVLRKEPNNVDALIIQAELLLRSGKQQDSADLVSQLFAMEPASFNRDQQLRLASLSLENELFFNAAQLFEWARAKEKLDALHLFQDGIAMRRIGEMLTAEQRLMECIKVMPGIAAPFLQLGHVYKATAHSDRAAHYYKKFISLSETEKGTGYWSLADLKSHTFSPQEVTDMERELELRKDDPPQSSAVHFALGAVAERKGNYAAAVEHYRSGNEIQATLKPFHADQYRRIVAGLEAVGGSEDSAPAGDGPVPILVVGLPRTGTTLIEQILSAHSRVLATDELPFLERIALKLEMSGGYPRRLQEMSEEERKFLREQYLNGASTYLKQECDFFVDKYPGNFLHIGLVKRIFPEAIIIDTRRDPRDTAISAYRQLFGSRGEFSSSFSGIYEYCKGYLSLMEHWQSVYPDQIKAVNYEQLVHTPVEEIQFLLDFCGLENETACFEFYRQKRAIMTPSVAQVTQPMFTSSIGQWRNYEEFLAEEMERLRSLVDAD